MHSRVDRTREQASRVAANAESRATGVSASVGPANNGPMAVFQRTLRQMVNTSPRVEHLKAVSKARNTASRQRPVVQRVGVVRFANVDEATPKYANKAAAIVHTLQNSPVIAAFLGNRNALITLDFSLANLASVRVDGDQVQISLSPWFFEQQSRGRIVGMLAHEFGIHPVADALMTPPQHHQEGLDTAGQTPLATGVGGDTINYDTTNQADHIFGAIAGNPRHTHYQETAYSLASTMLANQAHTGATNAHITDVMMSYLADLAMILATSDHRGRTVTNLQRTADYFNHVRAQWLAFLAGRPHGPALIPLTPPQQTKGSVAGEVTSIFGRFVGSLVTWSKSDVKARHTHGGGGLSPLSTNQTDVLADYALVLQPTNLGGVAPGFLNALDDASHRANDLTRNIVRGAIPGQLMADPTLAARLNPLNAKVTNYALTSPISEDEHRLIAVLSGLTVRVIQPNGLMKTFGAGPVCTLLDVREPGAHYRFAS
jgi:hypothetical protein